jgi:hypothetical protein
MNVVLITLDILAVVLVGGIYASTPTIRWVKRNLNRSRHYTDHIT